ncbi:DMT family transporter [Vibrio sp. B1FLJ16]|uniref:DMT family transporter n=1 Tax=Vibrio sp. B1FLJ16 TaxID=2751178 RepID=UPI0015F4F923|nr:DMT family transporter [Vibrio sp. B1FLJ16]CAD7819920.1 of the drug metabolite transporter (DMT) superfamily [Vibrio sp. B1FLJ16]CAE6941092.1 of the drug metabolite transporter (DMT) superfamily [Vibrio sp. B1FLJ16]
MSNSISTMVPIGVRFMVLSAFGFALMSATVKHVSLHGIPVFEIVAARAFVSLVISYLDVKRKRISVWGNNKKLLLARGAVGTFALMCVYYSVMTLPLAEATIFQYIHPAFTALLAVFFLKERIQPSTFVCIALCLLGVYVMIRPETGASAEHALPMVSVVAALLGALGSSVAYVIVRKLSQTEDSSVIIFYFPLVALPASIFLMGDNFVMPDLYLTIMLILVGVFTQIGQLGMTKAMQTQEAGKASAYSYIQIIFSGLIGIVIFNELPSVWTYIGGSLIVTGALINAFGRHIRLPFVRRSA